MSVVSKVNSLTARCLRCDTFLNDCVCKQRNEIAEKNTRDMISRSMTVPRRFLSVEVAELRDQRHKFYNQKDIGLDD